MAELQVGIKADVTGAKRVVRSLKEIKKEAGLTATSMQKTAAAASGTSVALQTTVSASGQLAKTQNLAAVANVAVARTLNTVATNATKTAVAETAATGATNRLTAAFQRMSLTGTKAFFKVGAGAKRFGTQVRTATGSLAGMSIAAQGLGALLAVGIGVGIKSAVEFEKTLSRIEGLVGIAKNEVEAFKKPLLDIAKATAKGPNELAEALFFVTSAGFKGKEALEILEASAKAAAAGLGETKQVADAVTSAVNAYGIENLSAAQSTDILVATVREGKAEADSIAGALGQVLPAASELGVKFEELGGTIAALTRIGLGADQGATALGATLAAIQKPGEDAKKALADAGTSAQELRRKVANEGLLPALQDLQERFKGNDEALTRVFPNIRALRAILPLVGKNAGDVADIFKRVADSTGATDKAFDAFTETSAFDMQQATVAINVALQKLGEDLVPAAAKALIGFSKAITAVVDATGNAGEFWAEFFHGPIEQGPAALRRVEELTKAVELYESRSNFLTRGALSLFDIDQAGIELTGTYDENLALLRQHLATWEAIVERNKAATEEAENQGEALEEIVVTNKRRENIPPIKVIDRDLVDKGKTAVESLRAEVTFLRGDLTNLQELGEEGIGLQEDFALTQEIMKQLQGELGITAAEVRGLINAKRELTEQINEVTDAFIRQEAARETIASLVMDTGLLAEKIALLESGKSIIDIEAAQQARQLMADLGEGSGHTEESLKRLILQQQAYNDLLGLMPVSKAEQLRTSLQTILDMQAEATDESVIAKLGRDADVLRQGIVDAEIAASGLDSGILLELIPKEDQIEEAMAPFRRLFEEGFISQEQLDLIGKGIEEKFKGTFDVMTEFAIQAARNIESALADFLYDPFEDGLDGMLRGFGDTLRKMTSQLLANALLQQFLKSFGGGGGILGAVAGALTTRADGGPVDANKPVLVGEEGPELLVPRQPGTVIPNGAMGGGQAPAPQVNVGGPTIVNTIDDGMIVAAFNRGGGEQAILNNMTENKGAFRSALGIE